MHKFALTTLTLAALYAIAPGVAGRSLATRSGIDMPTAGRSFEVPAAGTIEVAFSPEGGSEDLVIRVVDTASMELRILAYSFTSVPVVAALVRAKKRGVDVRLVADENSNGVTIAAARPAPRFQRLSTPASRFGPSTSTRFTTTRSSWLTVSRSSWGASIIRMPPHGETAKTSWSTGTTPGLPMSTLNISNAATGWLGRTNCATDLPALRAPYEHLPQA